MPSEGESKVIAFLNKGKEVGQFQCKIKFTPEPFKGSLANSKALTQGQHQSFNPLISRVLYSEEAAKDQIRMEASL
jgi:hypothetical protein